MSALRVSEKQRGGSVCVSGCAICWFSSKGCLLWHGEKQILSQLSLFTLGIKILLLVSDLRCADLNSSFSLL